MWPRIVLCGFVLLVAATALGQEKPSDPTATDGQAAFFAALDLREAGDCEGAIARFELAVARDPTLVQSHLYIAECCLSLGMEARAVEDVERYLEAGEAAVEVERVRQILVDGGADPDAYLPLVITPPTAAEWSAVRVELGGGVATFDNSIGLTVGGPALGVRILPWRFVEIAVRGRFGLGPHPQQSGVVQVPEFHGGVAASIPVGRGRIVAGPLAGVLVSRYGEHTRADVGILGEFGMRLSPPGSRLVFGASFLGGWLVRPTLGGELSIGLQLGPGRH